MRASNMIKDNTSNQTNPVAFLCHASENKPLARKIAQELHNNRIDTFFDEWEIRSGDSIRQKIDEGLGRCTHFIVLLTPESIDKEWVKVEMDAGFVRKVAGQCSFIPLRFGLSHKSLPPLLQGIFSPSIDNYEDAIKALVSDIYGLSKKTPLGDRPNFTLPPNGLEDNPLGLSIASLKVSEMIAKRSKTGYSGDPQIHVDEIRKVSKLSDSDIQDCVEELEELGLVEPLRA